MKVGIASDDQVNISRHFGRTRGFVITEIEDGKVVGNEYRVNTFSHHAKTGGVDHGHSHSQGHGHSHDAILNALSDCQVVVSRGMGRRIYDDLRGVNIESMITNVSTVEDAVKAYIQGSLQNYPEIGCQH